MRGVYQDRRVGPPRITDLVEHARHSGLFLDFDGTLSEIVSTPGEARALPGLGPVLERLAAEYRTVAVVTGRRTKEVAELVRAPVRFFGLYGLEEAGGPHPPTATAAAMAEAFPEIERAAGYVPGAWVEPKGTSAAVHYRGTVDAEAARRVLVERLGRVARDRGLELLEGKRVIELLAGPRPTKGEVVERVASAEGLRYVLVAGDDLADLDAFAAVDRLDAAGVRGLKVGVRSEEAPDRLLREADLVVEGPRGLLALLENLVPSA